jgi:hypothetical protein
MRQLRSFDWAPWLAAQRHFLAINYFPEQPKWISVEWCTTDSLEERCPELADRKLRRWIQ